MKTIRLVLAALVLVLVLGACSKGENASGGTAGSKSEGKQKTIAILTPYLSSVTTNEMVEKLKKGFEDKKWKANVVDTKGDTNQLASRMEDLVTQKVDAIVLVSTDPNQLKVQIKRAADAKIPVFGCDAGYIEGMTMNATSDNKAMSKAITDYLITAMGGKGNLVVLTHRPHPGVLARTQQLDDMLKQNPNIKVVTEQQVQVPGPIENARKQMESLLLANKDEGSITAVWAGWDEAAIGATQAIEAAGRKNIIVTGIDGTSQAVDLIQKGSPFAATIKQNFSGMADIVIEQLDNVFQGKPVKDKEMYAPASLITKSK
ncbi:sugar ABC transporter substrate-binding protein [Paenibacillus flagellatus]|uniref:Ribose ABC transporter substrate-binding protein n=1 Tax=Paenibacillus flagellatus TaxID=2211139 RepID=A0A2V5KW68_9BACL|nr:substrate-binding domain-containing protein [Paenibacillus flagellatus]PYI56507.1 ribose ABC transporter substrate-binding protein [Paenibacillus flagellatus]